MATSPQPRWGDLAQANLAGMIDFCQRLVQTPSLSGNEGAIAALVADEMRALAYDEVWIDDVGSVVGVMKGVKPGNAVMFNSHLDHVSPGRETAWKYPPYGGVVDEGAIWGVGASDTKGALAAQVYGIAGLRKAAPDFQGTIYVAGVVQEEDSGAGSKELAKSHHFDCAILGEATDNQLMRGHRGGFKVIVRATGVATHASVPHLGVNPNYTLARFLSRLREVPMTVDPMLGPATISPTVYYTDQISTNVIPGEALVYLDWRSVPGETLESAIEKLRPLAEESCEPGGSISLEPITDLELTTYTGLKRYRKSWLPAYLVPGDHPVLTEAHDALESALGRNVEVGTWRFCTDGPWLMEAGIPTLGFAPAKEGVPHTAHDHVTIAKLEEAYRGNIALAVRLGAARLDTAS